jgi:hypothetical protein
LTLSSHHRITAHADKTAPPVGTSTIISHLLDIDYEHKICIQAFLPGEFYKVPLLPNVTAVDALGDYHIAADWLAFIDGEGTYIQPFYLLLRIR